jgi:crossover junction endodeoxyribonuclease RuvC
MINQVVHIGIDVGLTGAIAVVCDSWDTEVYDMPVVEEKGARTVKKYIDSLSLAGLLKAALYRRTLGTLVVESQHSMPEQGVAGVFSLGRSYGTIEGVVGALGYPLSRADPSRWKKAMGCDPGKEGGRLRALELFPHQAHNLKRKKDHDRADALLLAEYGRRMREHGKL